MRGSGSGDGEHFVSSYDWADCTRTQLSEILPEAVVVLPVGATEQHGPHLPTGTDALIVGAIAGAAVRRAAGSSPRPLVLTPALPFGASDHHFPFGGTLSLQNETVTSVLLDLLRSVHEAGGSRALIVNGHGGNRGPCHSAAQAASTRHGMQVGYLDYWSLLADDPDAARIPGHAGAFETALVSHLQPSQVGPVPPPAPRPHRPAAPGVVLHSEALWRAIDGYSDQPADARAEDGARWFESCVHALASRITELAGSL
jgi:creatinine amidohydrolase